MIGERSGVACAQKVDKAGLKRNFKASNLPPIISRAFEFFSQAWARMNQGKTPGKDDTTAEMLLNLPVSLKYVLYDEMRERFNSKEELALPTWRQLLLAFIAKQTGWADFRK